MARTVRFRVSEGVAAVALNNPPSNIVTHAMRDRLRDVFAKIDANKKVKAVVLTADGDDFCVTEDIHEDEALTPSLGEICDLIENCKCPVVVGLQGRVVGEGLAIALAAHVRLAAENIKIGLPQVTLGLMPSAGITQRLPRLACAECALQLAVQGRRLEVKAAKDFGLISGVVDGDMVSAVTAMARKLVGDNAAPDRTRDRREQFQDMAEYSSLISAAKKTALAPQDFAKRKVIDCIEAAPLLPFETGLVFEQTASDDCCQSQYSKALRHVFSAQRAIAKDKAELGQGAIAERVMAAYFLAADTLVRKGVSVPSIDQAMRAFGFKHGPLRMMDNIGLQKVLIGRKRHFPNALLSVASDLVNKGAEGQSSGDGFYLYGDTVALNPEVAETVSQLGDNRQVRLAPATIQRLCIGAMAAMGERLLQANEVPSPQFIDMAMIHEAEYPSYQGGPMKSADLIGLLPLKTLLGKVGGPDQLWATGDLWDEALKTAKGFGVYNSKTGDD